MDVMSENKNSEASKEASDSKSPSSLAEKIDTSIGGRQHSSPGDGFDSDSQALEKLNKEMQPEKADADEENGESSRKQQETTDTLPDANQASSKKPDHVPPKPSTSDVHESENKGDPLPRSKAHIQSDGEFHVMLEQLKQHMAQNGDCNLPRSFKDNPKLGEWIIQQRRGYRRRMKGISMAMTTDRIDALEALGGWTWNVAGGKTPAANDAPTEAPQRTKIEMKKNKVRTVKSASHPRQVDNFQTMYEELRQYHAANGDCMVPTSYAANPDLSRFVNAQRRAHKELMKGRTNSLTKERMDALDSLGFVFIASRGKKGKHHGTGESDHEQKQVPVSADSSSSHVWKIHEEKYQLMFEQLKAYKEANGHCIVPPRYTKNQLLAEWVKSVRRSFSDKTQGKTSSLTEEKIDALNSLGFSWVTSVAGTTTRAEGAESGKVSINQGENTPKKRKTDKADSSVGKLTATKEDKWVFMLQKLSQYKEEKGDCQVPRSHPELGEWCHTQRRKWKERMEGGSSASMTDDRMDKLEDLGFQWVVGSPRKRKGASDPAGHEGKRHQKCEGGSAQNEKDKQRDYSVPSAYRGSDDSASEWNRHNDRWYSMLDELDTYRTIHGDCMVPRGYKENPQLAEWCKTQRRAWKNKLGTRAMTKERVAALEELGFSWVAPSSGPKSKKPRANADDGDAPALGLSETKERSGSKKNENRTRSPSKKIRDDNWNKMFQELRHWKEENGNCMVPRANNPKLAEWCKTQKRTFRKRKQGISLAMSQERIDALEALGFNFENDKTKEKGKSLLDCPDEKVGAETKLSPRGKNQVGPRATLGKKKKAATGEKRVHLKDKRYNEMLQELKDYKAEHGDCVVPRSYKKNPQLGEWVKTQRRKYKLQKEGKSNAMTEARQEALEKLGFSWFVKSGRVPGRKNKGKDPEAHSAKEKKITTQGEVTTTLTATDEKVPITSDQSSEGKIAVKEDSSSKNADSSSKNAAVGAKEKQPEPSDLKKTEVQLMDTKTIPI